MTSALSLYTQLGGDNSGNELLGSRAYRSGTGRVRLDRFHVEDSDGTAISIARVGQTIYLVLGFSADASAGDVNVGISLHDESDRTLAVFYSEYVMQTFVSVPQHGQFRCRISRIFLTPHRYKVGARVVERGEEADWPRDGVGYLEIESGDYYGSGHSGFDGETLFYLDASWEVKVENSTPL